ncbi:hypothetical protein [Robiginitalea sp. SC105]|uniref:hypothetical protein n=1 Tax=Robiginitalea sp. SC105 TaxID=2762332 RepID=UPI00163B2F80|nr:hypothetical protein [Robiginitalea sp. SC105]MBC2839718.1 hypothetical protein [Robiginitalea sp. SC105]
MQYESVYSLLHEFYAVLEAEVRETMKIPEDSRVSEGNTAVCLIDGEGRVHGKMFGSDTVRQRQSFRVAWTKASQVWLTGIETGEYERRVFTGEIPENANGIDNPDLIGWVGGQPVTLKNGLHFSVGFSGFRGTTDKNIVLEAFKRMNLLP